MNTDRQIGNAKSPAAVVKQPAAYQHSCYVASAAVVEVLFDSSSTWSRRAPATIPPTASNVAGWRVFRTGCYCLSVLRVPPLNPGEAWGKALPL